MEINCMPASPRKGRQLKKRDQRTEEYQLQIIIAVRLVYILYVPLCE